MFKKLGLLLISSISLFAMHNAQININQRDLEFDLNLDMGQYNTTVEPDTTYIGVSYLKASNENTENKTSNIRPDAKYFFEANFLIKQEILKTGLKVGLGVKTNFSKLNDKAFVAIPIGLDLSYKLPFDKFIPVNVGGELYYAPESLSFSNAKSYLEYRVGIELEVIKRGSIFIGYRNIDTNYEVGNTRTDFTYNKSGYFGFKFEF